MEYPEKSMQSTSHQIENTQMSLSVAYFGLSLGRINSVKEQRQGIMQILNT